MRVAQLLNGSGCLLRLSPQVCLYPRHATRGDGARTETPLGKDCGTIGIDSGVSSLRWGLWLRRLRDVLC